MSLQVIGAGFGRTGTDSLREALNILGLGPCHHMMEVMADAEQKRLWRALAQGAPPDWQALFKGFNSCLDWPSAFYWRELAAAYPKAKVILTWRDPEAWYRSFSNTILQRFGEDAEPESLGVALIRKQVFDGRPEDPDHAMAVYCANAEAVRHEIPPERLLVYEPGDGWEPLCAFLDVPVPDQPYPHRNTTADIQTRFSES
ncbi:MAG: sulfotransferase family protein [Rhodobacteraceae bacterium]|nr:sulfotransferase family protein [Paracoccaceae bacterium]